MLLIFNIIYVFLDAVGPSMVDDANNVTKADAGIFSVRLLINEQDCTCGEVLLASPSQSSTD